MSFGSWREFYASELQGLWLLLALPTCFLAARLLLGARSGGLEPARARFVDRYAIAFALLAVLDPIANGPLLRALDLAGTRAATVLLFAFVLLGDFRVFLLLAELSSPRPWLRRSLVIAAAASVLVPLFAGATYSWALLLLPELPGQSLWLVYELAFLALALWLRAWFLPSRPVPAHVRRYLRELCAFAATYYGLWAAADALLLAAGLDWAWALRALANQLYYGAWVPFVYLRFFASGSRLRDFMASK